MNKYFISGSAGPFYKNGMFKNFIVDSNCKKLLFIGLHHSVSEESSYSRMINESGITDIEELEITRLNSSNINELKGKFDQFDGIYLTGGLYDPLEEFWNKYEIKSELIAFIKDPAKLFITASVGLISIGKYFHTEMEGDAIHLSRFVDSGFALIPHNILIEVHYFEQNSNNVLYDRLIKTLDQHSKLNIAYAFDSFACIRMKNFENFDFELLTGSYHVYKK